MKTYIAHRQRIASEWVLPEGVLTAPAGPVDLCFKRGSLEMPEERPHDRFGYGFTDEYHDFYWSICGRMRTHRNGDVIVCPYPDAEEGLTEHILLGPIMADWLMWQGRLPLHANCLTLPGGAFAIVGPSGAGKSTLSAALSAAGAVPHCDDVIGVDPATSLVPFGTSRTKLHPEVMTALGFEAEAYPLVFGGQEKRSVVLADVPDAAPPADQPLRVIYCLTDSDDAEPRFEPLPPLAAPVRIMNEIFRIDLMQTFAGVQTIFGYCGQLAARTQVVLLHRKKDLPALPRLAARVRDHFTELTSRSPPT